jgi:hypothetical protein
VAFGYRLVKLANDPEKVYGIVTNPKKSKEITFTEKDRLIGLARE